MYYTIYMDEALALQHWDELNECNWLLKDLLCKDRTMSLDEKLDFYFKHRHTREGSEWFTIESNPYLREEYEEYLERKYYSDSFWDDDETYEDEDVDGIYHNPHMLYYSFSENRFFEKWNERERAKKLDENRRSEFVTKCDLNKRRNIHLRKIDEVHIYKSDFEAIEKAKARYKLNQFQTSILFGLIFFSRMNDVPFCRVGTESRMKGFKSCFYKSVTDEDLGKVLKTDLFRRVLNGKRNHRQQYDWRYLGFNNKDEVAWTFKTTVENNRLNLTEAFKEAMPDYKVKRCTECGFEFTPNSNRQKMCPDCRKEVEREKNRLYQQRYRERKGLK